MYIFIYIYIYIFIYIYIHLYIYNIYIYIYIYTYICASMVYNFFDKKTAGGTLKNEIISNKKLAEQLH